MQFFAFGFRIVTFSPSTCETPVCIWKWPEEQRLSSSANPLEANPAAMACYTAQPGTGTCSTVVFSRLFWKLNLISGDFSPFFFSSSRLAAFSSFSASPYSPMLSQHVAFFNWLFAWLPHKLSALWKGERDDMDGAQPKRFSAFNLSYSTSCWDLLLTLNKTRSHA